jgi:hypothetical protein
VPQTLTAVLACTAARAEAPTPAATSPRAGSGPFDDGHLSSSPGRRAPTGPLGSPRMTAL